MKIIIIVLPPFICGIGRQTDHPIFIMNKEAIGKYKINNNTLVWFLLKIFSLTFAEHNPLEIKTIHRQTTVADHKMMNQPEVICHIERVDVQIIVCEVTSIGIGQNQFRIRIQFPSVVAVVVTQHRQVTRPLYSFNKIHVQL